MFENNIYKITNKEELNQFEQIRNSDISQMILISDNSKLEVNLGSLINFPQVEKLALYGKFSKFEYVADMKNLKTLSLRLSSYDNECLESMMSEQIRYLEICEMKKISDLTFIEKAINLEKLYLCSLPAVTSLPQLNKIYALKIYELHKLSNLDCLLDSEVKFLGLNLCADKMTGTAIAKILSHMKHLEKVDIYIDRNFKREDVIRNQLKKNNLENLIDDNGIMNMKNFVNL